MNYPQDYGFKCLSKEVDAFFFTACSHCIYQQGILRKPSTNTTSVWLDTAVTII